MNKYEKALKNYFKAKNEFNTEVYKSMDLFEELIRRAKPIKPKILAVSNYTYNTTTKEHKRIYLGECCVCKNVVQCVNKYCHQCGQALDWSDNE